MSYCRFSSDDFRCDVYVYQHVAGGWATHVAGGKHNLSDEDLPPPVDYWEDMTAWSKRQGEVTRRIAMTEIVPIGLPHDGETFRDPTPGDCADRLERLRDLGYRVPQSAIDGLREDQKDIDEVL